jgi:hypothetical protein
MPVPSGPTTSQSAAADPVSFALYPFADKGSGLDLVDQPVANGISSMLMISSPHRQAAADDRGPSTESRHAVDARPGHTGHQGKALTTG